MNQIKITATIIKNQFHLKLPEEDSFSYKLIDHGIVVAIADGITRDPIDLPILPSYNSKNFKNFISNYPRPSPAKIVSEIFTKIVIKSIKKADAKSILDAIKKANEKIDEWNKKYIKQLNYLENDLAGAVAIVYTIDNKRNLNLAYNSDCGLAIFDKKGILKYITEDLMEKKLKFMIIKDWNNPRDRARIRKEFRNKLRFAGKECVSYGAFTGERQALSKELLKRESHDLEEGDFVIAFSDGARKYFSQEWGAKEAGKILIKKGIKGLKKYLNSGKYDKRERTIVAVVLK